MPEKYKIAVVGATGNVLMASVKAIGKTNIINAAKEPEIVSLGHFLIKLGAKIEGLGTDNITVTPIENENNNIECNIIPDRIEAGTFMIAAAAVGGEVNINKIDLLHLESLINLFKEIDIKMEIGNNNIVIKD